MKWSLSHVICYQIICSILQIHLLHLFAIQVKTMVILNDDYEIPTEKFIAIAIIITIIAVDYATIEGESRRPSNLFRLIQIDF